MCNLNKLWLVLLSSCALIFSSALVQAGVKIKDEKSGTVVDLGGRLQYLTLFNDGSFDNDVEYKVRRARIRLGITPHPWWKMFLQTEFSNDSVNSGGDVRLIDAFITFKPRDWFQLVGGERMAPASRQNLTSSGALMTVDRPGSNNYTLTWGLRGQTQFNNSAISGTRGGSVGDVSVRDLGVTLFGSTSTSDKLHFKYYAGASDGSTARTSDEERFTLRAQVNYGDAEPGYFGLSTYLGKKQTLAFGAAYDTQSDFAADSVTGESVDYEYWTVDAFAEQPIGPGTVTFEAAYSDLDLDDTQNPLGNSIGDPLSGGVNADQTQGNGYYAQAGYYINKWQPWFLYEDWDADGNNDAGDWSAYRVGLSYFFAGHNANVKVGYENTDNKTPGQNDIQTFVLGAYITF
ncbi:MAG: hypothetical protein ACR2O5_08910 [Thiogranum sp.]